MKQYFFVMLTSGANRNQDSVTAAKIQDGHMANITRLYKMGKILVAGPFGDEGKWRGIFIFDCKTEQEVRDYLKTDPAVAAGRLDYEIHPWWTAKNSVFK
ncbi:MAG TPA: YciI family protein, partial [Puia sp.]|nr:YciI family protein [Puia sp.]